MVSGGGSYVTSPSWIDVGAVTQAQIPGLALVNGAKYFVGVRAVSSVGMSPDKSSDGVVVYLPGESDAGTGCLGTGGTGGTGGASTSSLSTGGTSSLSTGGTTGTSTSASSLSTGGTTGTSTSASSLSTGGTTGAGGGPAENLLSGRACTCTMPGGEGSPFGGALLVAAGALRRRRAPGFRRENGRGKVRGVVTSLGV